MATDTSSPLSVRVVVGAALLGLFILRQIPRMSRESVQQRPLRPDCGSACAL